VIRVCFSKSAGKFRERRRIVAFQMLFEVGGWTDIAERGGRDDGLL
jgi:hypothetical protein